MTYEIHVDADGLNRDLHPDLVAAARMLLCYESTRIAVTGQYPDQTRVPVPALRCYECDGVLISPLLYPQMDMATKVGHLTLCHGYRMDGKRYDNQNNMIEEDTDGHAQAGVVPDQREMDQVQLVRMQP
jgi:hypothetical protein